MRGTLISRIIGITSIVFGLCCTDAARAVQVWINEIHYDNSGGDIGEFVEIAGPAGQDLTGWSVVLYNGSGGSVYDTINLVGLVPDQSNGFGVQSYLTPGIQNGGPDGLALVDNTSAVIQFLSYEGSFTGSSGPAAGLTSDDIGVDEDPAPASGESLQLIGSGNTYAYFTWSGPSAASPGLLNVGQSFPSQDNGSSSDTSSVPDAGASLTLLALASAGLGILSRRRKF